MARARGRGLCFGLVAVGLLLSAHLCLRALDLSEGGGADAVDVCAAVFGRGCDDALQDASSWFAGLPVAGWGVVYFAVLGALLLLGRAVGPTFEREAALGAFLLALGGAAVSVLLAVLLMAGPVPSCPLCFAVHAANLALLAALGMHAGARPRRVLEGLAAAGRRLTKPGRDASSMDAWRTVGFVTALLVGLLLHQWIRVEVRLREAAAGRPLDPAALIADHRAATPVDLAVTEADPRSGPSGAPVEIVVFTSFPCPGCRTLAPMLRDLVERHAGRVAVVFKHFPLDEACNPSVAGVLQPRACDAARAAEAAHRQGLFWPYHDALFSADLDAAPGALEEVARAAGLDRERFEADRASEAVAGKVALDVRLGMRLGVVATPTVYLDGRPVRELSRRTLEVLVAHAAAGP